MAKKITFPKITLSEVAKKQLTVLAYLISSWVLALVLVEITKDPRLVGLAPAINLLIVIINQELKKEGYIEALKK